MSIKPIPAEEFKDRLIEKFEATSIHHTELVSRTKIILGKEYKINYPSRFTINFVYGSIKLFGKTKKPYTEENLKHIIKLLPKKIKALKQTDQAKRLIYKDQLIKLVIETAIDHDEHGVYLRGDIYYVRKEILLSKIDDIKYYLNQLEEDLREKDQDTINDEYDTLILCDNLNEIKRLTENNT